MSTDHAEHVVITGGSSGIGRATAELFLRDGARVTIIDRHDPHMNSVDWIRMDLSDVNAESPTVAEPIDVLVNAAGLPPRQGTEALVLRVNFLALRRLSLALFSKMVDGGRVVNMASKAGAKWRENLSQVERFLSLSDDDELSEFIAREEIDPVRSYDLSKEAVVVWTKVMTAPLLERGLRMNAVSPGAIETPILSDFVAAFGERAKRGVAMTKGAGQAQDVADVIAFLASPKSHWLRGCNIESDGGLSAMLDAEQLVGWRP